MMRCSRPLFLLRNVSHKKLACLPAAASWRLRKKHARHYMLDCTRSVQLTASLIVLSVGRGVRSRQRSCAEPQTMALSSERKVVLTPTIALIRRSVPRTPPVSPKHGRFRCLKSRKGLFCSSFIDLFDTRSFLAHRS